MKKIALLPNVITAFGLSCGLFVIFKMNMTGIGEVDLNVLTSTAGILLLAVLADLLDGAIARAMNASSHFGGFFDSMADGITFGVGPAVVVLKTFSMEPGTGLSFWLTASVMVYSVCGVLRLVRFNVQDVLKKKETETDLRHRKTFTGLPIPAAAGAAVSANLFLLSEEFKGLMTITETTRTWIFIVGMIFLGYLMVCRLKFPSLKGLRIRVASFQVVFLTVISAVFIFYGVLHHFPVVFFLAAWSYIVVALVFSVVRMILGKRSKALEDFEPDPDEMNWED